MILDRIPIILSLISLCVSGLALTSLIVAWAIKCILEWSDDIAYWWKEFKERHK